MTKLTTTANLKNSDNIYAQLLAAHEGLSNAETQAFNARLILVLINHIGDEIVLNEALEAAK